MSAILQNTCVCHCPLETGEQPLSGVCPYTIASRNSDETQVCSLSSQTWLHSDGMLWSVYNAQERSADGEGECHKILQFCG